jgi:hypothetical protein
VRAIVKRVAAVVLCLAAFLLTVASVNASHKYCAWHGDDVGCAEIGNRTVTSCDREPDGHRVRAWYIDNRNFEEHAGAWDLNGSQGGCDSVPVGPSPATAVYVRACEEVVGCSNYVQHQNP